MAQLYEHDLLAGLEEVKAGNHELKAVQAARMSTLVLALLTTLITIIYQ